MTAYAIFIREETTDKEELRRYGEKVGATMAGHTFKALSAYGAHEVLEGPSIEGAVIIQFPTMAEAKAWYTSPAYQDALQHRLRGARYRGFLTEGLG